MVKELALDLACGSGRHARWLVDHGWKVTAVDIVPQSIPGVEFIQADLSKHEYKIQPRAWDAIFCWWYWQADLMPAIAAGTREGGVVVLAGKKIGRFATSLENYRAAFASWDELHVEEDEFTVQFMARKPFLN